MLQDMRYPGGKNAAGTYQKIINLFPPHRVYIEPFAGSAAILRLKRPTARNLAIDANPETIHTLTRNWPFKIPTLNQDPPYDLAEFETVYETHGPAPLANHYYFAIGNALPYLKYGNFTKDTLIYLDPPYLPETRSHRKLYHHELLYDDHSNLLDIIKYLPCMVMISGYPSHLYAEKLKTWNRASFQAITRGGTIANEMLWMNYPRPHELHEYTYLGNNFRERERITRRQRRWIHRLGTMPLHERQAIVQAFNSLPDPPPQK